MNTEEALLAALIAVLRRQFPPMLTIEQIYEGLKIVRKLKIEENIRRNGENKDEFKTGNKDNVAAGTALRLTNESIPVPAGYQVTMVAKPGNSGVIYFGNSEANCEDTAKRFDGLDASLAHSFRVSNVSLIWFDAATTGDGVSWYVEQ